MAEDPDVLLRPGVPVEINRYLFPGENVRIDVEISNWRWLKYAGYTLLASLLYVGIILLIPGLASTPFAWVLAGILIAPPAGKMLWEYADLASEIFVVTDRRLMLVKGIKIFDIPITSRQVNIMPLAKVTDMRYERNALERILGIGTFVFESAGQDQALDIVGYIKEPDSMYRKISGLIFAPAQRRAFDKLLPRSTGTALPISEPEDAWWKR